MGQPVAFFEVIGADHFEECHWLTHDPSSSELCEQALTLAKPTVSVN